MSRGTRIRLKLLWLRHSYPFNWAHKPLCPRFERDVIRLGTVYVCRSCTCLYAGLAVGIALLAIAAPLPVPILGGYAALLAATLAFSVPPLYKRLPRAVRDLLRFAAGMLLPACLYVLVHESFAAGAASLALLTAFWRLYFFVRRRRKLGECEGCPEYGVPGICSGFARQAAHVRRYEAEATEALLGTGYVPACTGTEKTRRPVA